jgi:hypothetical protein
MTHDPGSVYSAWKSLDFNSYLVKKLLFCRIVKFGPFFLLKSEIKHVQQSLRAVKDRFRLFETKFNDFDFNKEMVSSLISSEVKFQILLFKHF